MRTWRTMAAVAALALAGCEQTSIEPEAAPETTVGTSVQAEAQRQAALNPPTTAPAAVAEAALGQAHVVNPGSHRVIAHTWKAPVRSTNQFNVPDAGHQFAAAEVEACAGPAGDRIGPNSFEWAVAMPDNTRFQPANPAGLQQPALQSTPLQAGECVRGWVNFEVPTSPAPRFIIYSSGGASARWRL